MKTYNTSTLIKTILFLIIIFINGCGIFSYIETEKSSPAHLLKKENYSAIQHLNFGVVFEERDDIESAVIQYRKAIDLDTLLLTAYINLANCYTKQSKNKLAQSYYDKAIRLDSTAYIAFNNLANLYITTNRNIEEAITLLNKAVKYDTTYSATYFFNLSIAYNKLNIYEEAENYIDRAINVVDKNDSTFYAKTLFQKAKLCINNGKYDKGVLLIQKSMELNQKAEFRDETQIFIDELNIKDSKKIN